MSTFNLKLMEKIQKLKSEAFDLMMEIEKAKLFQIEATNKVNNILKQIETLPKEEIIDGE